jgi:hypothetical protein
VKRALHHCAKDQGAVTFNPTIEKQLKKRVSVTVRVQKMHGLPGMGDNPFSGRHLNKLYICSDTEGFTIQHMVY